MQNLVTGIFSSFSKCGLRNKLVHMLAFKPPQASYELRLRQQKNKSKQKVGRYYSFDDSGYFSKSEKSISTDEIQPIIKKKRKVRNPELYPEYDFIKIPNKNNQVTEEQLVESDTCTITSYFLNENKKNRQIGSVYLRTNSDYVVLFSHGNACDLGMMIDKLIKLVTHTKVSFFAYEYSGYGSNKGTPSDVNVIRNIKTAYNFLIHQLGYNPTQIIVYGYSIGSGPSVTLASNHQTPIGGLIIQSGFSSGLRVLSNKIDDTPYYDIFPNIDRIQFVRCPVFIIHGACDKIIPDEHAKQLAQKAQNLYDLWIPENVGHSGLENDNQHKRKYLLKLKEYFNFISFQNQTITDLIQKNTAISFDNVNYTHYYQTKLL